MKGIYKIIGIEKDDLKAADILVMLVWANYLLVAFSAIFKRIPLIESFSEYVVPIIYILFVLLSAKQILTKLRSTDILFFFLWAIIFIVDALFRPENADTLDLYAMPFFTSVLPVYYIGVYCDIDRYLKSFLLISIISLLLLGYNFLVYYPKQVGLEAMNENMHAAYLVLPQLLTLIMCSLRLKWKPGILLSIFGIVLLIVLGNRGSILCSVIFLFGYLFITDTSHRKLFVILAFVTVLVLFFWDVMIGGLESIIESIGLSPRILSMIADGDAFDANGRDSIANILILAIKEKLILGHGIMGGMERYYGIVYAHNVIIDIYYSFGIFFGSVMLIYLLYRIVKGYQRCYNVTQKSFLLLIVILGLVKLMLSSVFLSEPFFFFMIGYATSLSRQRKLSLT